MYLLQRVTHEEVSVRAQVLCIQGFMACRKHADRVILLVEMMAASGCPCFKARAPDLARASPCSL